MTVAPQPATRRPPFLELLPFTVRPLARRDATEICAWRYEGLLSFYDLSPRAADGLIGADHNFHALFGTDGSLVGYCCFGADARIEAIPYVGEALDLGLGMAPPLVGRGFGTIFVAAVIRYAEMRWSPPMLRLTVASFNRRARAVYQRLGFIPCQEKEVLQRGILIKYVVMIRRAADRANPGARRPGG